MKLTKQLLTILYYRQPKLLTTTEEGIFKQNYRIGDGKLMIYLWINICSH